MCSLHHTLRCSFLQEAYAATHRSHAPSAALNKPLSLSRCFLCLIIEAAARLPCQCIDKWRSRWAASGPVGFNRTVSGLRNRALAPPPNWFESPVSLKLAPKWAMLNMIAQLCNIQDVTLVQWRNPMHLTVHEQDGACVHPQSTHSMPRHVMVARPPGPHHGECALDASTPEQVFSRGGKRHTCTPHVNK